MRREWKGRAIPPPHSFNHAMPFCKELRWPKLEESRDFEIRKMVISA